jgi:hypothetical protein
VEPFDPLPYAVPGFVALIVAETAWQGKDAAELVGLDTMTGVKASTDLDEVLATKPDCAVYTAMADNRIVEALEDYRRILAAGVNVVLVARRADVLDQHRFKMCRFLGLSTMLACGGAGHSLHGIIVYIYIYIYINKFTSTKDH